jgi:hypothetical protein
MEKEIQNKIKRYVNLSLKFTKKEDDVVKYDFSSETRNTYVAVGSGTGSVTYGIPSSFDEKKSKAAKIRIDAEEKALLLEEYYEYLELQKDLIKYFNIVDKLNKEYDGPTGLE